MADSYITPVEAALFRTMSAVGGQYDAFQFALKCKGNQQQIEAEIQEREESIVRLQHGPMARGATPRVYMDAYLAGLREAIEIIITVSNDDPQQLNHLLKVSG